MTEIYSERRWIDQRYRVARLLGQGGMGSVYLVEDERQDNARLALKCVPKERLDRRTLTILRNEFLSLASLDHPNVVEVYDFGVDRETEDLYFTFEFVEGDVWQQAVAELDLSSSDDLEVFLGVLCQVLRGLEFVHCRSLLHADIKPDNVLVGASALVGPSSPDDHSVKLIDFGLAKREHSHGGEKILGTPYYVAPETILGAKVDRRTDLYSLGVVLYHLATGSLPFRGDSNLAILRSHVEKTAVPPTEVNPLLPRELGDIIERLLEKDPEARFQSALELLEAVNSEFDLGQPLETRKTIGCYLKTSDLVGREKELSDLRTVFFATAGTQATEYLLGEDLQLHFQAENSAWAREAEEHGTMAVRTVVLRGEKGLGRRRLVRELRKLAQTHGARFLTVECGGSHERDDFDRLITQLKYFEGQVEGETPTYISRGEELAVGGEAAQPENEETARALDEIAIGLLQSTKERPLVLNLHELDRAGSLVVRLVRRMVQFQAEGRISQPHLLISATSSDRTADNGSPFAELRRKRVFQSNSLELKLERFRLEETRKLVHAAFRDTVLPDDFVEMVLEESDGNPEVIGDILSFFVQHEKLTRSSDGWEIAADYQSVSVPGRVRRQLRERLEALPRDAFRLAAAHACLGEYAVAELATVVAGLAEGSTASLRKLLRKEGLLEARSEGSRPDSFGFIHASTGSMVYGMLGAEEKTELHERAGVCYEEQLRAREQSNPRLLAEHYLKAGNREKGVRFGRLAAAEHAREMDPIKAIQVYEQVLALGGGQDAELERDVHREIARLRFQVGEYRTVVNLLAPLCASEEGFGLGSERTLLFVDAARAHAYLGNFPEARRHLEQSEEVLPDDVDLFTRQNIGFARTEMAFLQGNWVESLRHGSQLLGAGERFDDKALHCRLYMLQAENHFRLNDKDSAASFCQRAIRLLDGQRDPTLLAWSLFCRGKSYTYKYQYARALKQFQLCLLLRQKTSTLDGQADCHAEIGALWHALGSPRQARENLEKALSMYKKSGNFSQRMQVLCRLGEVHRLLGENRRCHAFLQDVLQQHGVFDKRPLTMPALLTFAGYCLDQGRLEDAEEYLSQARVQESRGAGTGGGGVQILRIKSEVGFHCGDIQRALDHGGRAVLAAREGADPAVLASALTQHCYQNCRVGRVGEARRLLVSLSDLVKRHGLIRGEGWTRLLEALVLAAEENLVKAERSFAKAGELLMAHGSERDLADFYLERGSWFTRTGNHEQAYLSLEEGLYLSTKLGLAYQECRYRFAMGLLEAQLAEGSTRQAEENFRRADELAERSGFVEVLWQVRLQWGVMLNEAGRQKDAHEKAQAAVRALQGVVRRVPPTFREGYIEATLATRLNELLVESGEFQEQA